MAAFDPFLTLWQPKFALSRLEHVPRSQRKAWRQSMARGGSHIEAAALGAMIEGIHQARRSHRVLSIFATRTDSAMLGCAALEAIEAHGFTIVRRNDA